MKKPLLVLAIASTLLSPLMTGTVCAEDAKPENDVSFNIALTSDYRYRGISQTRLQPALQGGADYMHNPSGFYAGTWLSTIKWTQDAGGDGAIEWDLYGGKRGQLTDDITYDFGLLSYVYPANGLHPDANTAEIYGQLGYGPAYMKYSVALTNLFGFNDSKNSGYLDIGANIDLAEGLQLNLHAGHQEVKNSGRFSYTDWKIGLTRDFGVVSASIAALSTNNNNYLGPLPDAKNLGKTGLVVAVSKTF